ncbi:MAG: hypothetical protein H6708_03215 [Kofleriaceae bacterium]|nr:hypothetical protein [Myxococcales bacterium]MCB9559402.1 hypothetical protein [Kofleriaceae bacterium]
MSKTTRRGGAGTAAFATILCLGFTGAATAWADGSQDAREAALRDRWVDDPYQAHDTTGTEVRVGSLVGILAVDGVEYTGLGAVVAAGHRFGRLSLDAEYGYLEVTARGPSGVRFGTAHDLGVNVRYDVLRLGPRWVGANSLAALWVEAHAGRELRRAERRAADETVRGELPSGSSTQVAGGFGLMFDHRLEQPRGFPNRVGWMLGWRVIGAPRPEPQGYAVCRGSECTAAPTPTPTTHLDDTSLVVSSSLAFTW